MASFSSLCNLSLPFQAELLIAAPKVTQAGFAALLDCYTWKLANNIYGLNTRTSFVAVRPFSNLFGFLHYSSPHLTRLALVPEAIRPNCYDPLILSLRYYSLPCPYAAHGNGSARPARCPIASRRPSRQLLSITGPGIGLVPSRQCRLSRMMQEIRILGTKLISLLHTKPSAVPSPSMFSVEHPSAL